MAEPRTLGAPADWRSEVESVRRMVDGLRAERDEARAQLAAVTRERDLARELVATSRAIAQAKADGYPAWQRELTAELERVRAQLAAMTAERDDLGRKLYGTGSFNPGAAAFADMWEAKAKELEAERDEALARVDEFTAEEYRAGVFQREGELLATARHLLAWQQARGLEVRELLAEATENLGELVKEIHSTKADGLSCLMERWTDRAEEFVWVRAALAGKGERG